MIQGFIITMKSFILSGCSIFIVISIVHTHTVTKTDSLDVASNCYCTCGDGVKCFKTLPKDEDTENPSNHRYLQCRCSKDGTCPRGFQYTGQFFCSILQLDLMFQVKFNEISFKVNFLARRNEVWCPRRSWTSSTRSPATKSWTSWSRNMD